jgi:myo-inositol-1(or 4)-monophosphatase
MDLLQTAEFAAAAAVNIAREFLQDAQVLSAEQKDIKTLADLQMNEAILQLLQPTGIPILSEESDKDLSLLSARCWIIDPLDGTFNFTRKYPCAAVSICLWDKGSPVAGLVKDITTGHSYQFEKARFSRLQGQDIRVSPVSRIDQAILATGFPSGASYETADLLQFVKNVQAFKKIRAIGAASLMLSQVAAGVFDVYYEKDIYLWDVAAGLGLVENAGGKYWINRSGDTARYEVLASNAALFDIAKAALLHKEK